MDMLANPELWIALATLTALELVLGIDNIIFISILAGKLPPRTARQGAPTGHHAGRGDTPRLAAGHRLDRRPDRTVVLAVRARRSPGAT